MKFVVSCLSDDFETRILASRSKVFTSFTDAISYCSTVAPERKPEAFPIVYDAVHAAQALYSHVVKHHPELIESGDPEELMMQVRYESGKHDYLAVFVGDFGTGLIHKDMFYFSNELERLVLEGDE